VAKPTPIMFHSDSRLAQNATRALISTRNAAATSRSPGQTLGDHRLD
jgi:hypothetical protein